LSRMTYLFVALAVAVSIGVALWLRGHAWRKREVAMRQLLDGADALEAQIQDYRSRMLRLKAVLSALPSDMTASAMSTIEPEAQVRKALREVLAHRLWIQREGQRATQRALDVAVEAMVRSRESLAQQLGLLDEVSAQLAEAGAGLRNAYQEASVAMKLVQKLKEKERDFGEDGDDDPAQIRVKRGSTQPPTRH
jgi:hypothetical protein